MLLNPRCLNCVWNLIWRFVGCELQECVFLFLSPTKEHCGQAACTCLWIGLCGPHCSHAVKWERPSLPAPVLPRRKWKQRSSTVFPGSQGQLVRVQNLLTLSPRKHRLWPLAMSVRPNLPWVGFVGRTILFQILKKSHLFASVSRTNLFTFPTSLGETRPSAQLFRGSLRF